jgi:AcrR family transcriptional regulator
MLCFGAVGRIAGTTAEETRGRLIEAASQAFAENGYDGTRIAEIAHRAGVSSGAIYAHYASKAELLFASLQARSAGEIAGLVRTEMETDLLSTVLALGSKLDVPDARDSGLLIEAIVASRRDAELRSLLADGVKGRERFVADLIRMSQQEGDIDAGLSPDVAARFLLMIRLGARLLGILQLTPLDPEEWQRFSRDLVDQVRRDEAEVSVRSGGAHHAPGPR